MIPFERLPPPVKEKRMMKILVIEDNETNMELATALLFALGVCRGTSMDR